MKNLHSIPAYIINSKTRTNCINHILREFSNKREFSVTIVEAVEIGAIGLWSTIKDILRVAITTKQAFILICEDNHKFTSEYSKGVLFDCINEAKQKNADILCGGVSWFEDAVQISRNVFWVKKFAGLQFTIIFENFFEKIINADFKEFDAADHKISSLSNKVLFIHPFISIQEDFDYSDVVLKNSGIEDLFIRSSENVQVLKDVATFYNNTPKQSKQLTDNNLSTITVPTYVISFPERAEGLIHIENQFIGKTEFDVKIITVVPHEYSGVSLWISLRKIIELATYNDDDVIVVCEDDHEFTEFYSKKKLIQNIIEAHQQGLEMLSGGIKSFGLAFPITKNRFWINCFFGTQFLILYKSIFQKILDAPFDESITTDSFFSETISNKAALFPFISVQKEFGYSNITQLNNGEKVISKWFKNATNRLELIQRINNKYNDAGINEETYKRSLPALVGELNNNRNIKFQINVASYQKQPDNVYVKQHEENKIIVIIPFYNARQYIKDCFDSLVCQSYENYCLTFIDDCSTDLSLEKIPTNDKNIKKKATDQRLFALHNIYTSLKEGNYDDEDIIAIVDGDDFLLHTNVFNKVNEIYRTKNCLVTYGQYYTTENRLGHCKAYSKQEFKNLRQLDWRASHLKTFKFKVYKEFLKQDFLVKSYRDDSGTFYKMSYDVALMTPLLEIAGFENVFFNDNPIYGYRVHQFNENKINKKLQFEIAQTMLNHKAYKRIF